MAEYTDREHYIPLRKSDLIDLLCNDKGLSAQQRGQLRQFCTLVVATYHFEYLKLLEDLKNEYAPFDPDSVTVTIKKLGTDERAAQLEELFGRFGWLMERANFAHLGKDAIEKAMQEVSDWGLNMEVNFDVFERLDIYVRGDGMGTRYRRRWRNFFRREAVRVPTYQRLVLIMKLRPHKRLPSDIDTSHVFLKIFKDIPKADLEMLLPGARMCMPRGARWKLGGSFFGGLGYIVYKILSEIAGVLALGVAAFWAPLAAIFGYGYRQWYGYQVAKQTYSLLLTQSLYYQNLDSNGGVIHHLLDEAEEQECREAILAYYYLWRYAGERGWSAANLDDYVELDLERLANLKVDFEIDDALDKLEKLNVVEKVESRYRAHPIEKALEMLDWTWDNYFKYSNPEPETPPIPAK
jgi:Protein of unknown function (DUF3754)